MPRNAAGRHFNVAAVNSYQVQPAHSILLGTEKLQVEGYPRLAVPCLELLKVCY